MRTDWMKNNDKFGDDYSKTMVKEVAENTFEDYLKYSPESTTATIDGVTVQAIVQNYTNVGNRNKDDMSLSVRNNVAIRVGSIVEWDSKKWIVTKPMDITLGYQITSMFLLTHTFKFYHNKELYELGTFVRTGDTDVVESRLMPLNVDEYIMVIRDDSTSRKLSQNTRFILDDDVYQVMGHDTITEPGIMKVKIKIDQFNENDNRDLNIADYYLNQFEYSLRILNGESADLYYNGDTLQLHIEATEDGNVVESPDGVTYVSSDEYVCSVDANGLITMHGTGTAVVTVSWNGESATIDIEGKMVGQDNFSVSILGSDTVYYNQTSEYQSIFYNNDTIISKVSVWSLLDDDGISSTTLATILSTDGNKCVIMAGSKQGYVKLKCKASDNSSENIKRIRIRSLI